MSEKKNTSKTQSLFNQFFKIQSNERCTNYYLQNNILTVKASAPEGEIRIVGQANLEPQPFNFNTKQVVRAWLTKEQRVFASTANIQPQPIAYMERNRIYKGTFNFNDGSSPRKIFITAYPGLRNLAIGGEHDGILYVDLNVGF